MKNHNDPWDRLLGMARRGPEEKCDGAPFGFTTRVIAEWRAGEGAEEPLPWLSLLRGALICSSVILLLSLAANYRALKGEGTNDLTVADSIIEMSLNQ